MKIKLENMSGLNSDSFVFLVTTDNHLGYKQDDHMRRKDSFMAFSEALKIARKRDVDFILLGGDLFHINRPSTSVEHKCIKIIRQHMNAEVNRGTSFERKHGSFSHFHKLNHANFEDPNFKVPYPILTIHGNHDDPTGPNSQSICEKLATCGLLNYFGAVTSNDMKDIRVEPIILQKGSIKIALYGMGFVPDYKLRMAFEKGDVSFVAPPEDTFNVLVVHQNRVPLQKQKFIPDEMYPKFFHLIIRGHEHSTESPQISPESEVNGMVYQPGSTVATSISIMEAAPKKVGLISIKQDKKMDYELIELKSCRKMIFKDVSQKEIFRYIKTTAGTNRVTALEFKKYSREHVEQCIKGLLKEHKSYLSSQESDRSGNDSEKLSRLDLPLVRIRLEYTSKSERFDEIEISSQFYPSQVANKDIVFFKKQKLNQLESGEVENITFLTEVNDEDEDCYGHIDLSEEKRETIDVMIENFFKEKPPEMRLQALSLSEYTDAVKGSNEDGNVISKVLNKKKQAILKQYFAAFGGEESVKSKFHDEHLVHQWFLNAFKTTVQKPGGDEVMVIDISDG